MRVVAHRPLLSALALTLLALSGCGKSGAPSSLGAGPTRKLTPVAAQGAVSVATRNTTRLGGETPAADAAAVARTAYPGLTPASRPAAVVLVSDSEWLSALAASVLCSSPSAAPILYSEGNTLPAVTAQTLAAMHPLGAALLGGAQVIRVGAAAAPGGYVSHAVPAGTAPATAAAIARLALSLDGSHAPHQVIVLDERASRALAMPAAGLAAESGAPILFVNGVAVPAPTASMLTAMHMPSIYVIDAGAIAHSTLRDLGRLGHVTTIPTEAAPAGAGAGAAGKASSTHAGASAGASGASSHQAALAEAAVQNAIEVARFTNATFGWGVKEPGHGLVFANLSRPLDAPAAAMLSATGSYGPLLLLATSTGVPAALTHYLADIQPAYSSNPQFAPARGVYNHGWLIGDEHAIAAVTQAEIDSLLEISPRPQASEEGAGSQAE